ncbi:hypothetical protein NQ318_006818 [Aromia moschata]|uniref:Uncharacterized protein n=1 Tax=Aromia moschata TaxID=1265417 RepID=A0AAV8XRW1_9CUCU|nr:hypothetical protein NQ318_006818 [Aromia moschata]
MRVLIFAFFMKLFSHLIESANTAKIKTRRAPLLLAPIFSKLETCRPKGEFKLHKKEYYRIGNKGVRHNIAPSCYGRHRRRIILYEVCKLSNETGNVAPDLATLRRRELEGHKLIVIMCLYNGLAAVDYLQCTENDNDFDLDIQLDDQGYTWESTPKARVEFYEDDFSDQNWLGVTTGMPVVGDLIIQLMGDDLKVTHHQRAGCPGPE